MTLPERASLERVFKLAFAVHERAIALKAEAQAEPLLDANLTEALLRQTRELGAAANELHQHAIGCPPPKPAP